MGLIDFFALDNTFTFVKDQKDIMHHHLCNTLIYIKHDTDGTVSFNNTLPDTSFMCTNVIVFENTDGTILEAILIHDINAKGIEYNLDMIKKDLITIKNYIEINYPNYNELNAHVINYRTQAQKVSTMTELCNEKYSVRKGCIIDLSSFCLKMNTIMRHRKQCL